MRKPDAGNLHVRFDEGEGTQRSLAFEASHPARPLSTLLDFSLQALGTRASSTIEGQGWSIFRKSFPKSALRATFSG
jgi:hypothetical protein